MKPPFLPSLWLVGFKISIQSWLKEFGSGFFSLSSSRFHIQYKTADWVQTFDTTDSQEVHKHYQMSCNCCCLDVALRH